MDAVQEASFLAGTGIAGNVDRSRRRQVTLLSREAWNRFMTTLNAAVDPSARRANVLLSGVDLAATRDRVLRLGDEVRLLIGGEVTPCERMDEAVSGLREVMRPNWGGGAFAQVMTGGTVRVGDAAVWEGHDTGSSDVALASR